MRLIQPKQFVWRLINRLDKLSVFRINGELQIMNTLNRRNHIEKKKLFNQIKGRRI